MKRDLTAIQSAVLDYMLSEWRRTTWWPKTREILDHFGWSSTNYVDEIKKALESKGCIERRKNRDYRVLP